MQNHKRDESLMMMDRTASFYSAPSYHFRGAGGFPIYSGSRRQRGGGILGSLAKMVLPVLKNVGKAALGQAAGLAKDVASDVVAGRNLGQSLKQRGLNRLKNTAMASISRQPARRRRRGKSRAKPSGKRPTSVLRRQPPRKRTRAANF